MTAKGNKPPLALDMDFGEALRRFSRVTTDEVHALELSEKKKKRAEKKISSKNKQKS
jgi:hypothetical protein